MGLLDVRSDSRRASLARLVLDLETLIEGEWGDWVSLGRYAVVRKIRTLPSARRSLFRLKKTLAREGVELEVKIESSNVSARFVTQAIRDFVEVNVLAARALVARIEGVDGLRPALAIGGYVSPELVAHEYRDRLKSYDWIGRKHGIGRDRMRKILAASGPVSRPYLRRVEQQRPTATATRALSAADRGATLAEIAGILGCSRWTAQRFVQRNGRSLPRGRPRTASRN